MKREYEINIPDNYTIGNIIKLPVYKGMKHIEPLVIDGVIVSGSSFSANQLIVIKVAAGKWPKMIKHESFGLIRFISKKNNELKDFKEHLHFFEPQKSFEGNSTAIIFILLLMIFSFIFKYKYFLNKYKKIKIRKDIRIYLECHDGYSVYQTLRKYKDDNIVGIVGNDFYAYFMTKYFKMVTGDRFYDECLRLLC